MDSVQPLRQLYSAQEGAIQEQRKEQQEEAFAGLEYRMRALVFYIKPDHPFLTRHEE